MSNDKSKKSKKDKPPKSSKNAEKYEIKSEKKEKSKEKSSKEKSTKKKPSNNKSKQRKNKDADDDDISENSDKNSSNGSPLPDIKVFIAIVVGINSVILIIAVSLLAMWATTSCEPGTTTQTGGIDQQNLGPGGSSGSYPGSSPSGSSQESFEGSSGSQIPDSGGESHVSGGEPSSNLPPPTSVSGGESSSRPPQPTLPPPTASQIVLSEFDQIDNPNFECGVPTIEPDLQKGRIVGGAEAVPYSWPYTLGLAVVQLLGAGKINIKQMCGATLISPRHALTAAHCFRADQEGRQSYTVIASMHNSEVLKNIVPRAVVGIHFHPESTGMDASIPFVRYDFAVLTLSKDVVPNDNIKFACLPAVKAMPPEGTVCWAVGWGKTMDTGADGLLKQVTADIVSEGRCKREFSPEIFLDSTFCAGTTRGQDTCQGDSGGPLYCKEDGKWILYGVTSYGVAECGEGPMAGYGTVSHNLSWICCFMPSIPGCSGIKCASNSEA
ncbi:spermosin-like isoform X2 [Styela clava]